VVMPCLELQTTRKIMKVGDLVRCVWQPEIARIENNCAVLMEHEIKGELGIVQSVRNPVQGSYFIFFPKFNYAHPLVESAFEVISEGW